MNELLDILYNCSKEEFKVLAAELIEKNKLDPSIKLHEQRFGNRYIRTITVPADFVLVGKRHKQISNWVLLYGEMHTRTESESTAKLITDHGAGENKVNDLRIGVTTKETKWATLHTIPEHVPVGCEHEWVLMEEAFA